MTGSNKGGITSGRASGRPSSKLRSSMGSSGGLTGGAFKKVRSDMNLESPDKRASSPDMAAKKTLARPRFDTY